MNLHEKFDEFKQQASRLLMYRDLIRNQIQSEKILIDKSHYNAELNQKSSEIFKTWLEDLLENNVNSISDLVTSGLQSVVHDQNLVFKINQELKYNRLSMRFSIDNDGIEGDPLDSFGGGAVAFISFILRLAIMTRMKMGNLLLLDESLASLANYYVPMAADFMRQLSEKTGINILMVTHNDEFVNYAHTAYEGSKDSSLKLNKRTSVR
jgi:ABC-type molybdenum transport system ATPase subunit/photorepair protein PhrA